MGAVLMVILISIFIGCIFLQLQIVHDDKNKRMGVLLPFIWFIITLTIIGYDVIDRSYDINRALEVIFKLILANIPTGIMLILMYINNGDIIKLDKEKIENTTDKNENDTPIVKY